MSQSNHVPHAYITGQRIYLRLLSEGDLELLTKWINSEEVTRYIARFWPITLKQEQDWFEDLYGDKQDLVFGICLKGSDELIGTMGLHRINLKDGVAFTGALIGSPEHRGKGYGTEAKMHLLRYAFHELGLRKVCSEVLNFNNASIEYGKKCGYRQCGVRRAHILKGGEHRDVILTEVFREDWEPLWEAFSQQG